MRKISPTKALFPELRRRVLDEIFRSPDKSWYASELAEKLSVTPSSLQRELEKLTAAEIITGERRGNRTYFRPNPDGIIYDELRKMVLKTSGVLDVIRDGLKKYHSKIDVAFIFGSVATGTARDYSDVDLFIVGKVELVELASSLKQWEHSIQRPIEPIVMSRDEATNNLGEANHFLHTIAKQPKIFLIRRDNELARAFEEGST